MTTRPQPSILETGLLDEATTDDAWERGWRYIRVTLPDGRETFKRVLLTPEDYLNPQEGDFVPEDTFHSLVRLILFDILYRHVAALPDMTVFSDLIIQWPRRNLPSTSPDICVIPHVKDPQRRRGIFQVAKEGAQPILAIEVVSPTYRKEDREDKVAIYEKATIPEYIIFDQRVQRGQAIDEVIGYRLVRERYRPLTPDQNGLILCQTVGLHFGLEGGQPIVVDAKTGERLLTPVELEAKAAAEAKARAEAEARAVASEARLAELEAELKQLRGGTHTLT